MYCCSRTIERIKKYFYQEENPEILMIYVFKYLYKYKDIRNLIFKIYVENKFKIKNKKLYIILNRAYAYTLYYYDIEEFEKYKRYISTCKTIYLKDIYKIIDIRIIDTIVQNYDTSETKKKVLDLLIEIANNKKIDLNKIDFKLDNF